ncbi:hypothetical protein A2865_04265 [Candidatus Woesebacteria bacterium RIFCSPHIGHO2_01_FULL_39_17]|uniref:Mg2+ transporter n=3 Tax=Candidatus Woeseibacteriota TaxID=1752722 RepID=A0A0G0N6X3_9BACT|nr:MAG: Mg2+ transporter [Microgenomates group bacterium GW2011_GWC1_38_12]KKQ93189.1 MAG: Mg2+ transporter [Candidatus Woesebacteria bacterium GW2011_GWB1_39_10b]KKR11944.1 MAG: Mg2+ transporter [Candidatus Woesebacteria bacterium GW2011_GWA1_39_21b]OGM23336.1 MAG: hypothetical protein A2865_04265 [Candidatus Woesebacteria bacterium RIFCSPHIGHO2_01_FULL_39_17]OGM63518.1 MAG: hypothetical protein A3A52_04075 [Candidatus Woesebacteria bacterium RIFCSPLOWO2_01_FULL_39_14]
MSKLGELSKEISQKVIVTTLPPDAAGRRATTKVPLITPEQTIDDVRQILFDHAKNFDTINYIYIVSEKGRLHGVVSIKDIFRNPGETRVKNIEMKKLVKAHPQTDQEKVAHMALKAGIKAVPLVDENGYFWGVLPSDQIQQILDSESREDLLRLSGIIGKPHFEISESSVFDSFTRRIPWIIVGLFGGLITASAIGNFQSVLAENLVLASFIPLIAYIANAVANQTQTVFIRDLATQVKVDFRNYAIKQIITTFFIAIVCWALIFAITGIFWQSFALGGIVGLAMTSAIMTATILGLLIPQIINHFKLDPAVGGGPFATAIQDFLSVIIYFSIAQALL